MDWESIVDGKKKGGGTYELGSESKNLIAMKSSEC